MPRVLIPRDGRRFGRLVVIRFVGSKHPASVWLCQCDCGNRVEITGSHLDRTTRSCGCLNNESRAKQARKAALARWGRR